MMGDSAGGAITLCYVLKMRDLDNALPAAEVLFSPNTDLTLQGDTVTILKNADPILNPTSVKQLIAAYADLKDLTNPYVSAIYGNFSKGFSPTLIQAGTKEILSDSVRLYQALDHEIFQ